MAQWINRDQINRSKTGSILPPLVGLMADRHSCRQARSPADKIWVDSKFSIGYNYVFRLLFCLVSLQYENCIRSDLSS